MNLFKNFSILLYIKFCRKIMGKLTLIIDGNWLLMSRLSISYKLETKYDTSGNLENFLNSFQKTLLRSIDIVLKHFKLIDNIIFVADGGSWRNKVELPEYLKKYDIQYKGNRVKSDEIDWDAVFASFEEFLSILSRTGINVCREPNIEGDDWCYYWSNKLNKENINCIIWSKDKDLTQLVKVNSDFCFTTCWDKSSGFVFQEYDENDINYLMNVKYNENYNVFSSILKKEKIAYINPKLIVIEKILKGDAVDNIQPVLLRNAKNPKSDKKFKISSKDIDFTLDIYNDTEVTNYFNNLLTLPLYVNKVDKDFNDIIDHYNYNRTLVSLNEKSYPQYVLDIMNDKQINKPSVNIIEAMNIIDSKINKLSNILEVI